MTSSEYHRKQAKTLAGLALNERDKTKAAEISLMAATHQALADSLDASRTLRQPPLAKGDQKTA